MIELIKEGIRTLENSNNDLLKGTDTSAACYGFDYEIDSLNYMSVCEPENDNDLHDSYRCCSTSTSLYIFINMIENILTDIDSTNGNFDYELIPHLLHLFNKHLFSRLERFIDRLNEINYSRCQSLVNSTTIIFVIGIITTVLFFL